MCARNDGEFKVWVPLGGDKETNTRPVKSTTYRQYSVKPTYKVPTCHDWKSLEPRYPGKDKMWNAMTEEEIKEKYKQFYLKQLEKKETSEKRER
jgi:hypothetical protein